MKVRKFITVVTIFSMLALMALVGTGCETLQESPTAAGKPDAADTGSTSDVIANGEKLSIELRDTGTNEDRVSTQTIREDGTITLLYNQSITAVGKKKGELEEEILKLYVPKYFKRMTVVVRRDSLVFYVRGEVKSPGRQVYEGSMTALRAIGSAGDFTDFANRKDIDIIRQTGKKEKVNAVKALENPALDLPIYPGDVVYVNRRLW